MWNDTPKDGFSDTPQSKLVGVGRVAFALVVVLSSCGSSVTKAIGTSAPPGTVAAAISSSPTSAPVATTLAAPVATPPLSAPAAVAPAPVAPEAAVAGDIPDTQAFVTYTPPVGAFSIKVPEGWARSSDGTATLFTDKYNTIRVETVAMAAAPTVESVTKVDVPVLAAATKGFKPGKVSVVARNAGSAILALY